MKSRHLFIKVGCFLAALLVVGIVICIYRETMTPIHEEFTALIPVLTVKGAQDVEQLDLPKIGAKQLNYTVTLTFPKKAIDQPEYERLKNLGWTECTGRKEGWRSFQDISDRNRASCVWQHDKNFTKGNNLLLLTLRYRSLLGENKECSSVPELSNQSVAVMDYRNSTGSRQLQDLGLSCSASGQ